MNPAARPLRLFAVVALLLIAGLGAAWMLRADSGKDVSASDVVPAQKAEIEAVVREYLLANPELLPEMIENLRQKQASEAIAGMDTDVFAPFPGAVVGNPDGSRVLVEFSDYACGFCRRSVKDVELLTDEDDDVKVVIRELPILSPASEEAARIALAAAMQGKFAAFHDAMFETGKPTPENIATAARKAGLDFARAKRDAQSEAVSAEIQTNRDLAQQLGFSGTPAWVTKSTVLEGALGRVALREALYPEGS